MKPANTFTKKDVIVALVCFIFLLANIAAIGEGGRMRAKEAVCLSNLHKWGQIFQAYTADNDGFFHGREVGTALGYSRMWQYVYKPYYDDKMMRFCPTATNPQSYSGTFGTWNYGIGSYFPLPDLPMKDEREYQPFPGRYGYGTVAEGFFTGSYGMNRFVENMKGGTFTTNPSFWRRADAKYGDKVPVLLDCLYLYYWSGPDAEPPATNDDYSGNEMKWICINRHNGFVNACFLDFSARKVGLKELWTLKHSRGYNTCGPWTICGFGGNQQACAAAWDAAAPWMKDFPEY